MNSIPTQSAHGNGSAMAQARAHALAMPLDQIDTHLPVILSGRAPG